MQGVHQKPKLVQKVNSLDKSQVFKSSMSPAECYVCGKGLLDGHSITAKTFSHGTVLFCNVHYSLQ